MQIALFVSIGLLGVMGWRAIRYWRDLLRQLPASNDDFHVFHSGA